MKKLPTRHKKYVCLVDTNSQICCDGEHSCLPLKIFDCNRSDRTSLVRSRQAASKKEENNRKLKGSFVFLYILHELSLILDEVF